MEEPGDPQQSEIADATVAPALPAFTADMAGKTGLSIRTVQDAVQIGEAIPEDVFAQMEGTPLENSRQQLVALAALDHDTQREVVTTTDLTDLTAVKTAINAHRAASKPHDRPRAGRRRASHAAASRPEEVVYFVKVLGLLRRFVQINPSNLREHLTDAEVAECGYIDPFMRRQLDLIADTLPTEQRGDEEARSAQDGPEAEGEADEPPEAQQAE